MSVDANVDVAVRRPAYIPMMGGADPIIGHVRVLRRGRTEMQLRLAREHIDVTRFKVALGLEPVWVTSPALAHEVLGTKAASFVKAFGLAVFLRPLLGDGLLTSERETHAKHRKLLAPALAHRRIASYGDLMGERAARTVAAWKDGETLDASEAIMRLTLEIVGKTLFDSEVGGDADVVGEALTEVMERVIGQLSSFVPVPPQVPTPSNLRMRAAIKRLDAVVYRLVRERKASGEDRGDLLGMLLASRYEDGTPMSDRQIRDEAMTMILAGHETTANALAWCLYLLARHPDVRERLEAEVDALGKDAPSAADLERLPLCLAVLKEAMRLYPPAYMVARRATDDVDLVDRSGDEPRVYAIKKGNVVLVNVMGIHRREDLYPEPDRFDPDRFLDKGAAHEHTRCAYLSFGAGPRVCIGNHFALMEGQILLAAITRAARLELTSDAPVVPEPLVTLRPKGGLRVRVHRRC
ncbi:MAG: cytochrome P450 [Polyangiaceae bacterium]